MSARARLLLFVTPCVLIAATPAFAQGTGVALPPVSGGLTVSFEQRVASPGARPAFGGHVPGITIDGNLGAHAAITGTFEASGEGLHAAMAGIRISTDYFYGSGRDPVPGRFFGAIAAGRATRVRGGTGAAAQFTAGFELLVSRALPMAVHAETGYRLVAGGDDGAHGGRVSVGVVFGPHLR